MHFVYLEFCWVDLGISGFEPATVLLEVEFVGTLGTGFRGLCWCSEKDRFDNEN